MEFEQIKNKFIKLKKEELYYIANIAEISSQRLLSEKEKIKIHRKIKNYEKGLTEMAKKVFQIGNENEVFEEKEIEDVIIEFSIDEEYFISLKIDNEYSKQRLLEMLGINIDRHSYELTFHELVHTTHCGTKAINTDMIVNGQRLIDKTIHIFCGYHDYSEESFGPCSGELIYGVYKIIFDNDYNSSEVLKSKMDEFEENKIIIRIKDYVYVHEVEEIFRGELLNTQNNTIDDCIKSTQIIVDARSYLRSPEYKKKALLDKINQLYGKIKGNLIDKELLFSGKFLDVVKETYELPDSRIVEKEKVIKNNGKNAVIIIAMTPDKKYIITFQNRVNEKIIAEFPSGYIEEDEDILDAAKRELKEETGYETDDLFIIDQAYTSPGTDNSISYIVMANLCTKTNEVNHEGSELLEYGLFTELELQYLINNNFMIGAMNKLAYYNLINNIRDDDIVIKNKRIYRKREQRNRKSFK